MSGPEAERPRVASREESVGTVEGGSAGPTCVLLGETPAVADRTHFLDLDMVDIGSCCTCHLPPMRQIFARRKAGNGRRWFFGRQRVQSNGARGSPSTAARVADVSGAAPPCACGTLFPCHRRVQVDWMATEKG